MTFGHRGVRSARHLPHKAGGRMACNMLPVRASITEELIVASMTTHAPPRISQCGGMYTCHVARCA